MPSPSLRLGEYIVGERIGSGGMAVVHRATPTHGRFNCPVVIKRIRPDLSTDPELVRMFVREARVNALLAHPNIVRLLDVGRSDDELFIVLEFADGLDLSSVLRASVATNSIIPPELAVYIARQVLHALHYAHHICDDEKPLNLVHRDVSPGNVLLKWNGHVQLTDFGVASISDQLLETTANTLQGKYGYMSPEQIDGRELDLRSDVFSAGVVLAEALMSHRLFVAATPLEILLMARAADLSRLKQYGTDIPSRLREILDRALQRDRCQRYPSAAEFRDDLDEWIDTRGVDSDLLSQHLAQWLHPLKDGPQTTEAGGKESYNVQTFSGQLTQKQRRSAEDAARVGRLAYDEGVADTMDDTVIEPSKILDLPRAYRAPLNKQEQRTLTENLFAGKGQFSTFMPLHVVAALATQERTGRLSLKKESVQKEAYFVDGHPVFVSSNVEMERFGEFLIRRGRITRPQLENALRVMPHFGGHLGQALVGLHLLNPVDAVHLLAEQVQTKLVRASFWDEGEFRWQEDVQPPSDMVALHLSSHQVVLQSVKQISAEEQRHWFSHRGDDRPALDTGLIERFGFDPELTTELVALDGTRSLSFALSESSDPTGLQIALYAIATCLSEGFQAQ